MKKILTTLLLVFSSIFLFLNNTIAYEYLKPATISKLDSQIDKIPAEKKIQALDSIIKIVSERITRERNFTKKAIYTEFKSYLLEKKSSVGNTEDEILNLFEQYKSCDNGYSYINGSCIKDNIKETNNVLFIPTNNNSSVFLGINYDGKINYKKGEKCKNQIINGEKTNEIKCHTTIFNKNITTKEFLGGFSKNILTSEYVNGFTTFIITPEYTKNGTDPNRNFIEHYFNRSKKISSTISGYYGNREYVIINDKVLVYNIENFLNNLVQYGDFKYLDTIEPTYGSIYKVYSSIFSIPDNHLLYIDKYNPFVSNGLVNKNNLVENFYNYWVILNEDKNSMMIVRIPGKVANYNDFINGR